jgi:hypothetical protein
MHPSDLPQRKLLVFILAAQGGYTGVLGFALASTLLLVAGSLWSRAKV